MWKHFDVDRANDGRKYSKMQSSVIVVPIIRSPIINDRQGKMSSTDGSDRQLNITVSEWLKYTVFCSFLSVAAQLRSLALHKHDEDFIFLPAYLIRLVEYQWPLYAWSLLSNWMRYRGIGIIYQVREDEECKMEMQHLSGTCMIIHYYRYKLEKQKVLCPKIKIVLGPTILP